MPPSDDEIAALEQQLEPSARAVVALMRQSLHQLQQTVEQLQAELERQRAQNEQLRRMLFGPRSERIPSIDDEVRRAVEADEMFDDSSPAEAERRGDDASDGDPASEPGASGEGESKRASTEPMTSQALTDDAGDDDSRETKRKPMSRRKRGRKLSEKARKERRAQRLQNLPVVRERVEVQADQLPQGMTLDEFREVGDGDVLRRVEHVREHLVIKEYVIPTFASHDREHILTAHAPPGVVDGGHYGPGVYAHVVEQKCANSMPLYRVAQMFERNGCPIARSTLVALFHRAAELLYPIYERLIEIARADAYVNADETRMPVLDEGKCRDGWVWALLSRDIIGYVFSASRKSEVARQLLAGTQGYLQVDGYAAYDCVCGDDQRTRVGCWAHTRREFYKALSSCPEARELLDLVVELYKVEYTAADRGILGTEAHLELRQQQSKPVLDAIGDFYEQHKDRHPPKSPMGAALTYLHNQWDSLQRFVDDPRLPLDNNASENALRIHALGRKNFLFVGHDDAGHNLAVLQTIVATCRLHGVHPYDYIADLLIRTQSHPSHRLDELLPMNYKPPDSPSP